MSARRACASRSRTRRRRRGCGSSAASKLVSAEENTSVRFGFATSARCFGTSLALDISTPGLSPALIDWNKTRRGGPMGAILLLILLVLLIAGLPTWPHSRKWGYYPSGLFTLLLVVVVLL